MNKKFKSYLTSQICAGFGVRKRVFNSAKLSIEPWLSVRNQASGVEMIISGRIGKDWWDNSGTSAKQFRDELKKIPSGKKINVRINSEGGSIQDGLEIYNALKDRRAEVTCIIDGYAVSIASIIALAGSKTISPKSSIWMIHEPWSVTQGNSEDHQRSAEMLDKHGDMLAAIYSDETGKSKEEMRTAMRAESWFTGEEATAFGLADESPEDAVALAALDPKQFKNVPAAILSRILASPAQGGLTDNNNTQNNMDRTKIILALRKRGVTVADDISEDDLLALVAANPQPAPSPAPAPAPANSPAPAAPGGDIIELRAALAIERRKRVRAMVLTAAENKIPNSLIENWVERAVANEDGTMAELNAMPFNTPGGDPLGRVQIVSENPLEKIKKENKTALARKDLMVTDWEPLMQDAMARDNRSKSPVFGANTYSATLVTSFLEDGAITNLQNVWAMLRAFTMDFTTDSFKPMAAAVIRNVTAGSATGTDLTDFEAGNSTVGAKSATMHQYSQPFQVSNDDLQKGLRMEHLVTINVANFANKIIEVATVPITTSIFGAATVVQTAAAFSFTEMAALQAALKNSAIKNLILDGSYVARIANTPGFFQTAGVVGGSTSAWKAFGWDGIFPNSDWTGAGANVKGFACHPQAIAGVTGLPVTPPSIPGGIMSVNTFVVPGLQVTVAVYTWFNPKTRTMWTSYDIMAGFVAVDTTAGFLVTSA